MSRGIFFNAKSCFNEYKITGTFIKLYKSAYFMSLKYCISQLNFCVEWNAQMFICEFQLYFSAVMCSYVNLRIPIHILSSKVKCSNVDLPVPIYIYFSAVKYICDETWDVVRVRVDTMIESRCEELAFRVLKVCIRYVLEVCPRFSYTAFSKKKKKKFGFYTLKT